MSEKRKNKRIGLDGELVVKRLDDNGGSSSTKAKVSVKDVSKTGMGFTCDYPLAMGSVYEMNLTLWTKETIHCFVQIIRMVEQEGNYMYGGIFIGMSEEDASRISIYITFDDAGLHE